MGILFTKYKCTINFEFLSNKLAEIQSANVDLEFISDSRVPSELIGPFIQTQEEVKAILLEKFNEEIETYTNSGLLSLLDSLPTYLSKGFQLIVDRATQQLVGRLDMTIVGKSARLETLFVNEKYAQRGLSKWLIGSALLQLKDNENIKVIETNTDERNEFALKALKVYDFFYKYTIENFLKALQ
ncbi:MAG: hypothetical protein GZ087_12000 [Flavobacterium sp.]|nr:hypothetical protein [Flavobacterium sp.]